MLGRRAAGSKFVSRQSGIGVHPRRPAYRCHVASAELSPTAEISKSSVALIPVLGDVRAHESSLSVARVLEEARDGSKLVVTASLDKTIAAWRLVPNHDGDSVQPYYVEVQKIAVPGGPVFSIAPLLMLLDQPAMKATADGKASLPTIFCGNAAKEVLAWQPFMPSFTDLKLDGHTGWVRAVATYDKYLFSCGCNYLRQWDCTFATPKEINSVKLFTGDILAIAAGKGYVFTAGADGSLRGWSVDKASGAMQESAVRDDAHDGRISRLLLHDGFVYSCGGDGLIRVWRQDTLELVAEAHAAHAGEKVQCMAIAGNKVLYTGGDDGLIRAWVPETLEPQPGFEPLRIHGSSVRTLAAGPRELLVSGDSEGFVNFFRVPNAPKFKPEPDSQRQVANIVADIFAPAPTDGPSPGDLQDLEAANALVEAVVMGSRIVGTLEFAASLSPQPDQLGPESMYDVSALGSIAGADVDGPAREAGGPDEGSSDGWDGSETETLRSGDSLERETGLSTVDDDAEGEAERLGLSAAAAHGPVDGLRPDANYASSSPLSSSEITAQQHELGSSGVKAGSGVVSDPGIDAAAAKAEVPDPGSDPCVP